MKVTVEVLGCMIKMVIGSHNLLKEQVEDTVASYKLAQL
jgi:hypothetical protein